MTVDNYGNLVYEYDRLSIENIGGVLNNWHSNYIYEGSSSFERDYENVYYHWFVQEQVITEYVTRDGCKSNNFLELDYFVRTLNDQCLSKIEKKSYVFRR